MKKHSLLRIANTIINRFFSIADTFYTNTPKVYMFHNIIDSNDASDIYTVTLSNFEKLIKNKSDSLGGFFKISDINNVKINNNSIAITFDDAFEGVFTYAYPILKKYNTPFAIFISVSLIDQKNYLTLDQLKILSNDTLCTIGSHFVDHIFYRELNEENLLIQLTNSKKILTDITGKEVFAFAFPFGSFFACSLKNIKILKKTKYKMGFSTIPASLKLKLVTGDYFLPRINVTNEFIMSRF
jgi:peptidoglycan/xylan/chitin deacetylase (PgdA/CDA1 family)